MKKKAQQLSAADIAAQSQLQKDLEAQRFFETGITSFRDTIAPSSIEINSDYFRLGTKYGRTLYVYGYPRTLNTGWLSGLINMDEVIDISMYIYPVDTAVVMKNLTKKVTQLEASMNINAEKGRVRDTELENAYRDAEELRDNLQRGEERFFRYGLYITCYADSMEELRAIQDRVETFFGQSGVFTKVASCQQEQGLNSTLPQCSDQLQIRRNMNTGAISTSFPFTSADLSQENGILYGINDYNQGLIIFDRFSLENANMVVFAKSGAGKSYAVKLEALRSMMTGSEIIIIDPENEYQKLCDAVGGTYIRLSLNSDVRINPFDLPKRIVGEETTNARDANIVTLRGLLRIMLGGTLTGQEDADLDQALNDVYDRAGITKDPLTHGATPPTMVNLYDYLLHMGGTGPSLAQRLKKYTSGTFAGIFSNQSNIDINNQMIVFNIRDLEDELRPIAMYIVLSHIWNVVRADQRKRLLIVDEAWQLMQYEDSANFLFSLAKRARKYNLGLSTITQDVEDFMSRKMGRAIVANSSMQLLLGQSPAAVDVLADVFKLTIAERDSLTTLPVGSGLFFAGSNHVRMQVIASPIEDELVNTGHKRPIR